MKLTKRPYRLGRRGEAAGETRRRIVAATSDLHAEQGIAATTMRQIAARAGVSVGTVYHHFPSYADAIAACGAYTTEHVPAPTDAIFAGVPSRHERIERLASAAFDYYARLPVLGSVRRDQAIAATLRKFVKQEVVHRRRLAALAVGADAQDRRSALIAALVDFDVYQALLRQGFDRSAAAATVAALANAWLDGNDRPTDA